MKWLGLAGTVLVAGLGMAAPAKATPLTLDAGWTIFPSSPSLNGSWSTTFDFTIGTNATLTVIDMCHGGDQYEVFNFGSSLGFTSPVGSFTGTCLLTPTQADNAFNNPTNWGSATFDLGPGTYQISGITTIDGGPGANRAAIRLDAVDTASTPEPASILGLAAIAGIGFATRRKLAEKA